MSNFAARYSWADRMIHDIAFRQLDLQRGLAGIEDRMAASKIEGIDAADPVFVTALPRAGTTLLLEVLCVDPRFATHSYRDMPFVLCPMLWDRLAGGFRRRAVAVERAHGDGMAVDFDSVEAFEEMIWRAFWPDHYEADRIRTWTPGEESPEDDFPGFLRRHMRKLTALVRARRGDAAASRYISKNNANFARRRYLLDAFPDARLLIPFRAPAGHAASLARQHVNFLQAHAEDDFARRYMEGVGHLEFGAALRPIDVGGWLSGAVGLDPREPAFWRAYWRAVYAEILDDPDPRVALVSYDRLCAEPARGLAAIADFLDLPADSPARGQAGRFRAPTTRVQPVAEDCESLHEKLTAASIV